MKQTAVEWTPKNGERVWIKVFSNWSLGTYIGFDTIENKHLVREDADGGGHLMASRQVLPEDANPNVPKQPTAVEWLVTRIAHGGLVGKKQFDELVKQAKAMEEDRLKEAVISTFKNVENYATGLTAEEYYNEQFKSE